MTDWSPPSSPWFSLASPPGTREVALLLAIWLLVSIAGLVLVPIHDYPLLDSSWDVLHSGRRFAETGFVASKLQPRWSPLQDAAPYLNYTHYPPFPYWFSGAVQSIVSSPRGRIQVMTGIMRVLGFLTVAAAYLVVRQVGVGLAGAALAAAALERSRAFWWIVSELSWIAWLPLFLFAGTGVLLWAVRQRGVRWRVGLILGGAFALLAALCAFDAWLWFPVFTAVLLQGAAARGREARRWLLAAVIVTCGASGLAVATRLAINVWYFGSTGAAVRDWREALTMRATGGSDGFRTPENAVNYKNTGPGELNRQSKAAWIGLYAEDLPARLVWLYGPDSKWEVSLLVCAGLLALPVAWIAWVRRRRDRTEERFWPGPLRAIVATELATVPFVLAAPAITVQQPFALLTQAPAVLVLLGWILHAALAPVGRIAGLLLGEVRGRVAIAMPALILATWAPLDPLRREGPRPWPVPLAVCRAAAEAVAGIEGVVFVNVPNTNPLMFFVPLASKVAIKPIAELRRCPQCFSVPDPIRLLAIDRPRRSNVEAPPGWTVLAVDGLPDGWRLCRRDQSRQGLFTREKTSPDQRPPQGEEARP